MINNTFDTNNYDINSINSFSEFDNNSNIFPQIVSNDSAFSSPFDAIIGETGSATLNHNQKTISFSGEYDNPVVLATSLSRNGGDAATVRITDISGSDFTAFVQEPNYLAPGEHAYENFSYVVIEAGTYKLSDGTLIEANTIDSDATTRQNWESIEFDNDFDSAPIVLSQVQTHEGGSFVRTRMQDIDADGFKVSMEEEEKLLHTGHATETIGFLAISQGSGVWGDSLYQAGKTENTVTHSNHLLEFDDFDRAPNFLAGVASYDGTDSVGVRQHNLSADGVTLMLDEDISADREREHTTEVVNFLAIEGSGFLTGASADLAELSPIQVTAANPDDKLYVGQIAKITWDTSIVEQPENPIFNFQGLVDIGLYNGDDLVHEIANRTSNDGETYWTIPTDLPNNLYELRIFESAYYTSPQQFLISDELTLTASNIERRFGAEISIGIGGGGIGGGGFNDNINPGNSGDVNIGLNNDFDNDGGSGNFPFRGSRTFDANYYLEQNPDVAAAGVNPLRHYRVFGRFEGRDPNPVFDTSYYLEQNPDVAAAGINPLKHYFEFGFREGRRPSITLDTDYYLEQNPDVAEAGVNPVQHYLEFGRSEGRNPNPVFDSFNKSNGILVASANLTNSQFIEFQETASLLAEENPEVALALPIIYVFAAGIVYTAISLETLRLSDNIQQAIDQSNIGVFRSPFPGSTENSPTDNNTGGSSPEEVDTGTEPFDLGEATRIELESIPNNSDFLEDVLDGQFEFPLNDDLFIFFNAAGREGNTLGDLREQAVADMLGVELIKQPNGEDIKVFEEGASESVAVDVFGPNGELILVGGPAKTYNFSALGQRISDLEIIANIRGVKAQYYFADTTPEEVIKFVEKKLRRLNIKNVDKIFIFPEVSLPQ